VELFKHGFESQGNNGLSQFIPVIAGGQLHLYPPFGRFSQVPIRHGFDEQLSNRVSQCRPKLVIVKKFDGYLTLTSIIFRTITLPIGITFIRNTISPINTRH
jgi:hypothetical protein